MLITGRYTVGLPSVVGPRGHCPPFTWDANQDVLRARRPPSVEGGAAAPQGEPIHVDFTDRRRFRPLVRFWGQFFLGQKKATERSPRKYVVVSCILQHSLALGASRAQSEMPDAQPFASALSFMAKSTFRNCTKRALLSAKISHALSQRVGIFPAQPWRPHYATPRPTIELATNKRY